MKRLFGFLFVFTAIFSFSSIDIATAAISREQFDSLVDNIYRNDVLFVVEAQTTISKLSAIAKISLKNKLYTRADPLFTAYGAKVTTTEALMRALVATSWADEVEAIGSGNEFLFIGSGNLMENLTTLLRGKYQQAQITESVQTGRITQEQATQARTGVATAVNATLNKTARTDEGSCFTFTKFNLGTCVSDLVTWLIKNTLMQIGGFLLWLTSNMFTHVVQVGILDFKSWAPDALYPLWVLVRQIISLGVVFVGLYLGFMYILGREDKFAHYIPWVLIFALFINFSYPIARFAVDISNVISLNVYAAAFGNEALNGSSSASAGAVIMNRLGLSDLVMGATYVQESNGANIIKGIDSVPAALIVVVFIFYAAYVFFMATAILAIRTAALVFLTIASPFLFIDSVLPLLGDKAQQIRKIFFEQLAVGPVFMILIGLTTKFLLVFSEGPLKAQVSSTLSGNGAGVAVFFNVFMMIIMLHITLKVTKTVAGTIGQYATDAMGKVGGFAMGAATGGAGLLARNTMGRLAMKARDSKWVTNNANSAVGRRVYDMSNSLANNSYDLRNSSVVAGGMQKAGLRMGAGRTAGYEKAMEDRRKDILTRGERIKTRYERNVEDDQGNIIHRKGDVDKGSSAAYDKYVSEAGGSVFMSKDQKQLAREALGNQADETSKKRIAEAKQNSTQDAETYKAISDDPKNSDGMGFKKKDRKENYKSMLEEELKLLEKTDPSRSGQQAQSLLQSLKAITESEKGDKDAFDRQLESLSYRYLNMTGKNAEDIKQKQAELLNQQDESVRTSLIKTTEPITRAKDQLKESEELFQKTQTKIQQLNEKYNKELEELTNISEYSSILGPNNLPIKKGPDQAKIDDLNRRKTDELTPLIRDEFATRAEVTSSRNNLKEAEEYQKRPKMMVSSTDINPDDGYQANSNEDIANRRAAKLEAATKVARKNMEESTLDINLDDTPETHNPHTEDAATAAREMIARAQRKTPPSQPTMVSSSQPRPTSPSTEGATV